MSHFKTLAALAVSLIILTMTPNVFAAGDDSGKQTADLLRDRAAREAYLKQNPLAVSADQGVNKVTGGDKAKSDKIYNLSADVFDKMLKENGNDPVKLQEALMKAQRNPAEFLNSMTPEQRKQIESMAKEMEAKK